MAEARSAVKAKLFCGILTKYADLLEEIKEKLTNLFGEIDTESSLMKFEQTDYYTESMGKPLLRKFFSFAPLIAQESLREIKLKTNALEKRFAEDKRFDVTRPVNLDPGILTASRLVLASCKDYSHRIYLGEGVYAEVTLIYRKGEFAPLEWTYPDYRSAEYREYFSKVRSIYLSQLHL
ncbi:MAG: DUF4416 family protein [Planctomycetota bacterium]|nr:DUF4416 family protein [Planctomycetota bacterium]